MTGDRILVPIDFSPESARAAECAASIAGAATGSLTLLHVYDMPGPLEEIVPGADAERDIETAKVHLRARLDHIAADLAARGFKSVHVMLAAGPIVRTILEQSETGSFAAIVMGTHGRSGVRRLLMGSVAEGVMRGARCTLVMVHVPASATHA